MVEVSEIQRGIESAETVQPGEGDKHQMRGVKKTESSFSQWYSIAGQEAMGIN